MSDPDYWFNQRYEDMFYKLHGHLPGVTDTDCSLCEHYIICEVQD